MDKVTSAWQQNRYTKRGSAATRTNNKIGRTKKNDVIVGNDEEK